MAIKFRVDSMQVGSTELNLSLERFLDRLAEEWELLFVWESAPGEVTFIHRRKMARWL